MTFRIINTEVTISTRHVRRRRNRRLVQYAMHVRGRVVALGGVAIALLAWVLL